ncbi:MAG: ABC transporter permease, partial [Anaeroplasmataceae bacterium]|nr:ABC transporter permease [Anaeroplasmataceae bacterium]
LIMAGFSLILFLIFLFLIFNYYKSLIETNKKEIGLLFSLGCPMSKVIRPYLLHALYIIVGILLPSIGITFGFYQFLVNLIQNQYGSALSYSYNLWNSLAYAILFYIVISLLVTFFSIWKYYKKNNPLDALRGN